MIRTAFAVGMPATTDSSPIRTATAARSAIPIGLAVLVT